VGTAVAPIPGVEAQEDPEEAIEVDMAHLSLRHNHSRGSPITNSSPGNGEEALAEAITEAVRPNTMADTINDSSKFYNI
jgi:hypothetical protein